MSKEKPQWLSSKKRLQTTEELADYLRGLIESLEARTVSPEEVHAGVTAAMALAQVLDRPRGMGSGWLACPSPARLAADEAEAASKGGRK